MFRSYMGGDRVRSVLKDDNKVRPIGKMIFMCVSIKKIGDMLYVSAEINGNRVQEIKRVEANYFSPLCSVIGGGEEFEKGCAFRLKELIVLNEAEESCINSIRKYAYYRYQLT